MAFGAFEHMITDAVSFFVYATTKLVVLFIGISFVVGVINELISAEKVKKLLSARKGRGYMIGAGLGALTPFCSCSTIPVTVGLLKARAGFGPTMSFLFASPLVNPVIVGLFLTAFGLKITVAYSVMALAMAMAVGYLLNGFGFEKHIKHKAIDSNVKPQSECGDVQPRASSSCCPTEVNTQPISCCTAQPAPVTEQDCRTTAPSTSLETSCCGSSSPFTGTGRWGRIFRDTINQFKTFLPYILIGIGIGAILHGFVPTEFVTKYAGPQNSLAIPLAAVVGVPLYVRASTMIPIAVSLVGKGMSLGAVIALVIGGAGASIPEVVMLKSIFRMPILVAFLLSVFGIAISSGFALNFIQ
jgi:uncharacterized membrane protein YraQ (UPF0718 family)